MDPYSFSLLFLLPISPPLFGGIELLVGEGCWQLLNENQWYGYKDVRNMHIGFILYDFSYFGEITIKPFTPSD
jgi:hypothetical protein